MNPKIENTNRTSKKSTCCCSVVCKMPQVGNMRKFNSKSITEKQKILKKVDKGNSSASVAAKYSIPKQTFLNCLK